MLTPSLSKVMHRIIGALSATKRGGIYAGLDRYAGSKQENYGLDIETESFLDSVARCRLVFLGEIHSVPQIVAMQAAVLQKMAALPGTLHVIFEHFSFEMQGILENYQTNKISFDEMVDHYDQIGTEGHNLQPYRTLLENAKASIGSVKLHAGFLPRTYARQLMKESEAAALKSASEWLKPNTRTLEGTEFHYNLFESMLSGRNIHEGTPPLDRFQRIYKAQLLKDVAMAQRINTLIQQSDDEDDRFLVIAGNGHLSYYQGVPERVLAENPHLVDKCCLVTSHEWDKGSIGNSSPGRVLDELEAGPPGANPADYLYVFQDGEDPDTVKNETREAYDKVGETAHIDGNLERAKSIMSYLGYTKEEIDFVGTDGFNFQGVGNPFRHAKIRPGERVLDVGSGLGVDSILASFHTGDDGKVIGIDISPREVNHAQARATDRGLDIRFSVADMESIPLPDDCIDVVISNGAFCLAPNKERAFAELYRVLKPGGRIAVCTTTIQSEKLDASVQWPLCMRMFIAKNELEPMCKRLGYVNVTVDDTDSKMTYELPEEFQELNPQRNRVHIGSKEFEHLQGYDMDEICARVCVIAHKPELEVVDGEDRTSKGNNATGLKINSK